jgi:hypothetical protein
LAITEIKKGSKEHLARLENVIEGELARYDVGLADMA